MKFTELPLKPEILRALKDLGYQDMTPIQEQTFQHIRDGRDIIAMAETGSGKTAACGVPMIQRIDPSLKAVQGLIMVPTRELALQYVSAITSIAKYTPIAPFAVYGGFAMDIQNMKLEHGVHILVATPGRLIDLLYNSPLRLNEVCMLVLDEADEMLNMGFISDVEFIISCLIHEHQTLLFSATMPKPIKELARKYLKDPAIVELNVDQVAPQSLKHHFMPVPLHNRFQVLCEYLAQARPRQAILFCNSRIGCEKLHQKMKTKYQDKVEMIHGGLEQSRRTSLFNNFRNQKIKYMIATNIASRGLDFTHVSHVINYDFPKGQEAYTHRTGRTARMGREGIAMTFYSRENLTDLATIIRRQNIQPVWEGEEPDLGHVKSKRIRTKKFFHKRTAKGR